MSDQAADDAPTSTEVDRSRQHRRVSSSVATGLVCGVATLLLGLIRIGRAFGYDEGFTYYYFIRGGSVRRALTTQIVFNNHPMFSAIQAVAWRLGLVSEQAQRLGPALCGAIAVGLVAWFVARHVGAVAGVAAGVVLALNPIFLDQFRQLRGYALATAAVVAAGAALWRSWDDHRLRWLIIQGALMVIAVTTHAYSALTLLMLAAASIALRRVRPAHFSTWLVAAVVAIGITFPLIDDIRANTEARGNRYLADFPLELAREFIGWSWPAVAVIELAVVTGIVTLSMRSKQHLMAVAVSGAILVGAVAIMWQVVQPYDLYVRFFVSAMPLVAALAGFGVARLPRPAQVVVVIAMVWALLPGALEVLDSQPRTREAAALVNIVRAEGLEVCGSNAEPLFVYTSPFPQVSDNGDLASCDVYVSVLGLGAEQRARLATRFEDHITLRGGIIIWADSGEIDRLERSGKVPAN